MLLPWAGNGGVEIRSSLSSVSHFRSAPMRLTIKLIGSFWIGALGMADALFHSSFLHSQHSTWGSLGAFSLGFVSIPCGGVSFFCLTQRVGLGSDFPVTESSHPISQAWYTASCVKSAHVGTGLWGALGHNPLWCSVPLVIPSPFATRWGLSISRAPLISCILIAQPIVAGVDGSSLVHGLCAGSFCYSCREFIRRSYGGHGGFTSCHNICSASPISYWTPKAVCFISIQRYLVT